MRSQATTEQVAMKAFRVVLTSLSEFYVAHMAFNRLTTGISDFAGLQVS